MEYQGGPLFIAELLGEMIVGKIPNFGPNFWSELSKMSKYARSEQEA